MRPAAREIYQVKNASFAEHMIGQLAGLRAQRKHRVHAAYAPQKNNYVTFQKLDVA
jgi:hypothetical protein